MHPAHFPRANLTVSPLPREAIPTACLGPVRVTVWKPDEAELQRLIDGGFVTLTIYDGCEPAQVIPGVARARDLEINCPSAAG